MHKTVSVIIPFYNSENYLEECINSVLNQTYKNFELILINDCSIDNSEKIVKSYIEKGHNIIYKKLSINSGQGICRNLGIKLANGDYITFLDSDDFWSSDKIEKHLKFHEKKELKFSFTNIKIINEKGCIILKRQTIIKSKVNYKSLLTNNYIPTSTVLINKALVSKYKFPNYRKKQDYILWLEILKKESIEAYFFDNCLTTYRKHKNQITNNKLKLIPLHFNILRRTQDLSVFKSFIYTLSWGALGFYKHFLKKE